MSVIKNNSILQEVHGKMGNTHAYRKLRGKMYMVNLPAKPEVLHPNQKAFKSRFQKAANYAKAQTEDPETRAMYETGITEKKTSAYLVALSDMLTAPVINFVKANWYRGAVGDIITIDATDDFKVTQVLVVITAADGTELESGKAVQDPKLKHLWRYTATVANPAVAGSRISATAFDLPQNETKMEVVL